jgi:flagellar M-ring protein FliF
VSAPAAAAVSLPTGPGRTSETTNYEVSRTTRHTVSPRGQLARLSVAVILDDERTTTAAGGTPQATTKAWDQAGIQRIHGLVAAAVGLNAERGDQLTVENIAFDTPQTDAEPAAPTIGQRAIEATRDYWPSALRGLAIFALGSFALFGVLRPLARRATGLAAVPALPAAPGATARLPTVQEMEGQIEAEMDAQTGGPRRLPVLTKRVAKLASEEPEQLARIVRGWITEDER